jgi:hypothetical protein
MINKKLELFVAQTVESRRIGREDVETLLRTVLPDGIADRDEADLLIALDRTVEAADPAWGAYLVFALVDYAVWGARPTGYVDPDTARWLVASLGAGAGPTQNALRAAAAIVREAQGVDEALTAFALRRPAKPARKAARSRTLALAA